jgi:ketosteroid isomerase-like protein
MSQENVEIVRQGIEAWEGGDLAGFLEVMSDDLVTQRPGLESTTYHGKEGLLEVIVDWVEGFAAELIITAEEFIDAGECVMVRVHNTGHGEASGAPVEHDFWFVFRLEGGKIVQLDMYADKAPALEAAGLSE